MKKNIFKAGIGILLGALLVAGCSNNSKTTTKTADNSASEKTEYPLTIENFAKAEGGTEWTAKEETFKEAPKSVLANTKPAAELLLHLGLKDSIAGVGATFGEADESVATDFADLKGLSETYISKEVALSVSPDLVFGRGGLFDNSEWGVGTVDSLNDMGINTYVLESSITGGTFDSIYTDITNLGKIFNVKEKAAEFSTELKDRQKTLEDKLSSIKEEKTFALIFSTDPNDVSAYSISDDSFSLSVLEMVKLKHIFPDATGNISVEKLIEANPDVLILQKWDESDTAEKMYEGILANDKLSSMTAVKNKAIYIVNYNHLFGYSYQSLDGVEKLAKEMYPDLFK